jgi:hypothetical protein
MGGDGTVQALVNDDQQMLPMRHSVQALTRWPARRA